MTDLTWTPGSNQGGPFQTATIKGLRIKIVSIGSNHVVWFASGERARFRTSQRFDCMALPDLKARLERKYGN